MSELSCPGVGRNVQRQCTDKACAAIFTVCNLLLIALLIVSSKMGNISKITHGSDYNGNVCGEGYPANITLSEAEWKATQYLWYPFSFDAVQREFRIASSLHYGICVSSCNPTDGIVRSYGGDFDPTPREFKAVFASSPTFYRCVPNFNTYNCPSGNCTGNNGDENNGKVENEMGFTGFFFGLVQQVYASLWITFLFLVAAVALCFLWIIILRRAVKPVVIGVIVLVLVVGGAIIIALFAHYNTLQKDPASKGSDSSKFALAVAIISSAGLFLFACVMAFMWKAIMLSCDIIEEGSRIIVDVPQIMLVPVWTSGFIFSNLVLCATIAALLYTVGTDESYTTVIENSAAQLINVRTQGYNRPSWVDWAQLYNLFMALWILAYQNGLAYMTISLTGVVWFFSTPGNVKQLDKSPVCESYCTVIKFHGGTVAFGTLLFTIIAFARLILRAIEKKLHATAGNNAACCLFLCCAQCCLSCLDRIVRFLTEHGFVMTAMTGKPLLSGARDALALLMTTPAVLSINVISDIVIAVSRILIVIIITFAGVAALNAHNKNGTTVAACGVVLATGTWYIAGTFTRVLTVCIDTTLLCFCYDAKHNNGMDRPYYAPDDLKMHIEKASQHHKSKEEERLLKKEAA